MRWIAHLVHDHGHVRRAFPRETLDAIEARITQGEAQHSAEIRFVVEAGLGLVRLARGVTPRARALQLFATLGVWDTEGDNGVLVYVLLADHAVEIVADRAAARAIAAERWLEVCRAMTAAFAERRYREGALEGVERLNALLADAFPPGEHNPDELPNRPTIL